MLLATSWLDYVASIGTAVGAIATLCAVVVALFGPARREKQKRPQLSLSPETEMTTSVDDPGASEARIWIRNAAGRDTAEGVEVFVDAQGPHTPGLAPFSLRPAKASTSTVLVPMRLDVRPRRCRLATRVRCSSPCGGRRGQSPRGSSPQRAAARMPLSDRTPVQPSRCTDGLAVSSANWTHQRSSGWTRTRLTTFLLS